MPLLHMASWSRKELPGPLVRNAHASVDSARIAPTYGFAVKTGLVISRIAVAQLSPALVFYLSWCDTWEGLFTLS